MERKRNKGRKKERKKQKRNKVRQKEREFSFATDIQDRQIDGYIK